MSHDTPLSTATTASVATSPVREAPFHSETVTHVRHWTDSLFSFRTTRSASFRFVTGQFVMLGLEIGGKPLLRAYSIASPGYAEELEFYSIKVPGGPLTSHLKELRVGDRVLIGRKPTGTLILDGLRPGRNLYMLSTGTGLAPFIALAQEPETYERFEKVVVTHTVRQIADLSYSQLFSGDLAAHEFLGELAAPKLVYYPSVTREPFRNQGRITDLIASGKLYGDIGLPDPDPAHDRLMICGGPAVLADLKAMLLARGFEEGSASRPGDFVIERAFAES